MTTLICTGSLFSNWRNILENQVPTDSSGLWAYAEISTLANEICEQQFADANVLNWKPFTADNTYIDKATQLFSSIESEPLFIWYNPGSCLYLNFWKCLNKDIKFVLSYSSPELELSNYIDTHPSEAFQFETVMDAWLIRTRALLTFYMNNRDRCVLLNVSNTESSNKSFIEVLNKEFGLELVPDALFKPPANEHSVLVEFLATTLLLNNHQTSELYDEVRSAATRMGDQDESIASIQDRSRSLVNAFLTEVASYKKLREELYLNKLQIDQMQDNLEYYFNKSNERQAIADVVADYLGNDPLLRIARQVRQAK